MKGICSRCGRCCLYIPFEHRNQSDYPKKRCKYLIGEIGNTACSIWFFKNRLGIFIDDRVTCGLRTSDVVIPECTQY